MIKKTKQMKIIVLCVCVCCCARSMVFDRDRIRAKKKYINNMVVRENKSGRKVGVELVDAQ